MRALHEWNFLNFKFKIAILKQKYNSNDHINLNDLTTWLLVQLVLHINLKRFLLSGSTWVNHKNFTAPDVYFDNKYLLIIALCKYIWKCKTKTNVTSVNIKYRQQTTRKLLWLVQLNIYRKPLVQNWLKLI